MCGRFTVHAEDMTLHREMAVENARIKLSPRYNIAPTQLVAAVVQEAQGRTIDAFRWGLVPFWAKDLKIGNHMINARAETIAAKPAFKAALKRRRELENHLDPLQAMRDERQEHEQQLLRDEEQRCDDGGGHLPGRLGAVLPGIQPEEAEDDDVEGVSEVVA